MQFLKQGTAQTITFGPMVGTDGFTIQTALTIQKANLRVMKNGSPQSSASADQGASDVGAPHDGNGIYRISLDTTDTDTLGRFRIAAVVAATRPIDREFMICPANVYDSLFGASKLQVDGNDLSGNMAALLSIIASKTDQLPYQPAAVQDIPSAAELVNAIFTHILPVLSAVPPEDQATFEQAVAYQLAKTANQKVQNLSGLFELFNRAGDTVLSSSLVTKTDTQTMVSSDV
jgi:hypothetical protein